MRGFKIGKPTARVWIAAVSAVCTAAALIALSGAASAGSAKHNGSLTQRVGQRGSIPAAKYLKQSKNAVVQARKSPTAPPNCCGSTPAFTG